MWQCRSQLERETVLSFSMVSTRYKRKFYYKCVNEYDWIDAYVDLKSFPNARVLHREAEYVKIGNSSYQFIYCSECQNIYWRFSASYQNHAIWLKRKIVKPNGLNYASKCTHKFKTILHEIHMIFSRLAATDRHRASWSCRSRRE